MRCFIVLLLLFIGLAFAPLAVAGDLVISRAALEDATGTLTIADVTARAFTPIGPTLARGFSDSVHWLRLRVKAPAKGSAVVLFIRQAWLNEIRLYEADAGAPQGWKTRVTGTNHPYHERDRAATSLGFVVHIAAPEATYYLRLNSYPPSQLSVAALEPDEAERLDHRFDLLEVLLVTPMLLLLLWAIHCYYLDRLPILGLFAIYQAVYTLYGITISGYLAPFVPAGVPQLTAWIAAISYCGLNFTNLLFCRALFKPYEPPPLLMRGLNLLLLAFPLQLAAIALGHTYIAMVTNLLLFRIIWWYFVIMAFTLRREQLPRRRVLQLFFVTTLLILILFSSFSGSQASAISTLGRQLFIANGLIVGGFFAMILNARSLRLILEAQQSAMALQARSEFIALLSHEIRTPLNALVGFSTLALKATDPVKLNQYHTILEQSSRLLLEVVNDILDMSKIEAGRMDVEAVPFNLRQLVAGLEEPYRSLADQKRLVFKTVISENVPAWVRGDPVRLRQILVNLLSNAVKFTESGSVSCTVSLSGLAVATDPRVRFEVRDTGIGIPESNRAQLFQPFRQLDPTISRTFGGTGLGLAIVRSLTELMKGDITVDSREGVGSCFTIELPLQETEAAPDDRVPAQVMATAAGSILVVEDNTYNRRLLEEALTAWGHQVTLAGDGHQALEFAQQQRFAMIVLDIRMPGIDGIEVARRLRCREQEWSETPVPIIAITADADAATREACLTAGINAVLTKPVSPEQLTRAIATHGGSALTVSWGKEPLLNGQTCSDLGDNPERARQYRAMLLRDIDEELLCLQTALGCDDRMELVRAAHTLKGLCGHLANRGPADLAVWLRQNGPSARPAQMGSVIEQLRTLMNEVSPPLVGVEACTDWQEDTP
ncbi:MAG: response regulator [Desulfobacterales bacterium]|nr:response regulator [Desulfobacterales bacterium]